MQPLVSIITPTYNRSQALLPKAIQSVLDQTYKNWELIVIDDGSIDETKVVVESYNEPRIKYIYQENQGHQIAKNNAMLKAAGEWFVYLDDDNALRPDHLETILEWFKKNPNTIWGFPRGTRIRELYQNGNLIKTMDDSTDFPERVTPQDIVWRKLHTDMNGSFHNKVIVRDGIRFDSKLIFDDWDFFLTLSQKYPENFLYIPVILYDYWQRFGGDGMVSQTTYRTWIDQFEYIYQKHKNDKLMVGQTWYPDRVNKWKKLADDFDRGLLPPYHLYYFQDK